MRYDTRRRCCPQEQHRSGYYTQALQKEGVRYSTTPICTKDYASIMMRDDRIGVSILSASIIASSVLARLSLGLGLQGI